MPSQVLLHKHLKEAHVNVEKEARKNTDGEKCELEMRASFYLLLNESPVTFFLFVMCTLALDFDSESKN